MPRKPTPKPDRSREGVKPELQAFGDALHAELLARGMTQRSLGAAIGVSQSQVSTWVNAIYEPNPYVVDTIEVTLGLQPGELSRHLGYLPLSFQPGTSSVREAIAADQLLDARAKAAVSALYDHFVPAPDLP